MWLIDVLRRIKIAAILFVSVILIGTIGFTIISEGDWFSAFYMTSLTLTTIGFHEVIDLSHSPAGRIFTVIIAFSGIGIFTYLISNVAALFVEGDIQKSFYHRKMEKRISKMSNHYVICGCGRVGRNIAEELHHTKRQFVIADISENSFSDLPETIRSCPVLVGDCTDDDFLKTLGVEEAAGVFVSTMEDNINLVVCLTVRQLNPNVKIVVRVKDINLTTKLQRAGADRIISPNYIGGLRMTSEMLAPTVTSFLDELTHNENSNIRIEEVHVGARFEGKELAELKLNKFEETLLMAIRCGEDYDYIPKQDTRIKKGSHLVLMTTPEDRKAIESLVG
ncbi:MAG: potassium channel protein [Marinoscillum sp.]